MDRIADNFVLMQDNLAAYGQITRLEVGASEDGLAAITDEAAEKWAYRTEPSVSGPISAVSVPSLLASVDNGLPFITKIGIEGT